MRKYFFLALILVLAITGCAGREPVQNKTEIEFWTIQLSGFSDYINGIISEYESINPEIKIKWIDVPFAEAEKRALAAVLSNNVPDLINMNTDFGSTLASKGALLNIKPMLTSQQYDSYIEPSWRASSIDSFIFGIPWYITSSVTIYNREIWDGQPPKTYYDLKNIAQKTHKYAMMPALTENGQMLKLFNKYDIPIVNKDKNKALFNTKKAEEVLSFWKYMYDNGYIPKESITEGHRESLEKFMAGETTFITAGENFINIIKENSPGIYKHIGVSEQLKGSNNKADFSVMNFVIPKKTRHPQEALNFALFLTNSENQLKLCKLASVLPSQMQSLDSPIFYKSISAAQLKNSLLQPLPALDNRKDLYEIIDFMTQDVLLGNKTPENALNDAVKEWDKLLN